MTQPRSLRTFEAFRNANFRWFFLSLLGNFASMNTQMFIRGWLVYELTGSFEALGLMSAANGVTGLLLSPWGGVLADRVRQKKHVVQTLQLVNIATALVVGLLLRNGSLVFEHLIIAALVQGAGMTLMMPSRQALTPDVVGMDRLMNALALTTAGMNGARLLVPGLAGWTLAYLQGSPGDLAAAQWVYFAMAIMYAWSLVWLFQVKIADRVRLEEEREPVLRAIASGFRYVLQTPVIRMLLGFNFLMVVFGMTYFMMLPGFAKAVLDAGPERLGLMTSISGIGSLTGSLIIASMPSRRRARVLLWSSLLLGVSLIGFAASTDYWVSVGFLAIVGLGSAGRMSLSNVLVQSYVADEFRGRVMSIYMMEFSLMSLGMYGAGFLAQLIGPQVTVGASAVALVALTVFLLVFVPAYRNLD